MNHDTHTQTTQKGTKGERLGEKVTRNTHRKFKQCFKSMRDAGKKIERHRNEQEKDKVTNSQIKVVEVPKLKS